MLLDRNYVEDRMSARMMKQTPRCKKKKASERLSQLLGEGIVQYMVVWGHHLSIVSEGAGCLQYCDTTHPRQVRTEYHFVLGPRGNDQ